MQTRLCISSKHTCPVAPAPHTRAAPQIRRPDYSTAGLGRPRRILREPGFIPYRAAGSRRWHQHRPREYAPRTWEPASALQRERANGGSWPNKVGRRSLTRDERRSADGGKCSVSRAQAEPSARKRVAANAPQAADSDGVPSGSKSPAPHANMILGTAPGAQRRQRVCWPATGSAVLRQSLPRGTRAASIAAARPIAPPTPTPGQHRIAQMG